MRDLRTVNPSWVRPGTDAPRRRQEQARQSVARPVVTVSGHGGAVRVDTRCADRVLLFSIAGRATVTVHRSRALMLADVLRRAEGYVRGSAHGQFIQVGPEASGWGVRVAVRQLPYEAPCTCRVAAWVPAVLASSIEGWHDAQPTPGGGVPCSPVERSGRPRKRSPSEAPAERYPPRVGGVGAVAPWGRAAPVTVAGPVWPVVKVGRSRPAVASHSPPIPSQQEPATTHPDTPTISAGSAFAHSGAHHVPSMAKDAGGVAP